MAMIDSAYNSVNSSIRDYILQPLLTHTDSGLAGIKKWNVSDTLKQTNAKQNSNGSIT